jgi:hypothetical protein
MNIHEAFVLATVSCTKSPSNKIIDAKDRDRNKLFVDLDQTGELVIFHSFLPVNDDENKLNSS